MKILKPSAWSEEAWMGVGCLVFVVAPLLPLVVVAALIKWIIS